MRETITALRQGGPGDQRGELMEQATCMPRLEGGSFSTHLVTPGWGAPQRGRSWDDGNLQLGNSRVQRLHGECVVLRALNLWEG